MPPAKCLFRKQKSVIETSYAYDVGDGYQANIWQLLAVSKYPSADAARFSTYNEKSWLTTPRTTRSRMKKHVLTFLRVKRDSAQLALLRQHLTCEQGVIEELQLSTSCTENHSSPRLLSDAPVCSDSQADGSLEASEPKSANNFCGSSLSETVFSSDPSNFVPAAVEEAAPVNGGNVKRRRLKMSELFNSFVVKGDISKALADEFVADYKREDPIMDLHMVPTVFKNRLKIPKMKRGMSLIGFRDEAVGRCYHFGLYAQMKRLLGRVLEATFGNGPRPKVSYPLIMPICPVSLSVLP